MRYDRLRARVEAAIKTAPAGAAIPQKWEIARAVAQSYQTIHTFCGVFSLSTAFQFPALGEIFSLCLGGAIFEMPDILLCTASVKKPGTFWNLWIFSNLRPPKIQTALSATTWHSAEAKSRNPLTRPALRGVVTGRRALCDHLPLSSY